MTPKQILDSFSETLMQDERILSGQERALLSNLLQHAKAASGGLPETQEAVRAVIASAVGETVAQRAFAVLGGSIVERILENRSPVTDATPTLDLQASDPQAPGKAMHTPLSPSSPPSPNPQPPGKPLKTPFAPSGTPPSPNPQPPGVKAPPKPPHHKEPQPPHSPLRDTPVTPISPKNPQPPGGSTNTTVVAETSVAVANRPALLPAQSVVLDEFLAPQELEELTRFTLAHEGDFSASEVVAPTSEGGVIDYEHRSSRVLDELAQYQDLVLERIKPVLPQVLKKLGMEEFDIARVEAQITASNDGDFFRFHNDNGSDPVASRHLTFVYFFHREPRQFEGGELRIHDARLEGGAYVSGGSYQTIVPQQNQIVFFPCEMLHEITPVKCPSRLFADSRFTLNGWLRR